MKAIEIVQIWVKGQVKEATILKARATNIELNESANFWYALLDDNQEVLTSGNLMMLADDYDKWQEDTFVWDWIASQLNLTITGDYVSPVQEESQNQTQDESNT